MKTQLISLMVLLATLVGCAEMPPQAALNREMIGVADKSPMFTNGYGDGCQSGLSAAGDRRFAYVKDTTVAHNPEYKTAWEDGFRVCQSRQEQRNNEMNSFNNRIDYGFYGYHAYPHHRHHRHRHSGSSISLGFRL